MPFKFKKNDPLLLENDLKTKKEQKMQQLVSGTLEVFGKHRNTVKFTTASPAVMLNVK